MCPGSNLSIDFLIVLVSEWIEKHHKTWSEQALSDNEKSRVHTDANIRPVISKSYSFALDPCIHA